MSGASDLSRGQQNALNEALHVGAAFSPTTRRYLPAILMVESSLCVYKHSKLDPIGFGCGQLHQATLVEVTGNHYTQKQLLEDYRLNITLTARVLEYCVQLHPGDVPRALICYNAGPSRIAKVPSKWRYVKRVMRSLHALERHPLLPEGQPASPKLSRASGWQPLDSDLLELLATSDGTLGVLEFQDCMPCQSVLPDVPSPTSGTTVSAVGRW